MNKCAFLVILFFSLFQFSFSQKQKRHKMQTIVLDTMEIIIPRNVAYQGSHKKDVELIHTKLAVSFDWHRDHLLGQATITARPYFYPIKQIVLDAKSFTIKTVSLLEANGISKPLVYTYDTTHLTIYLEKEYTRFDTFKLFIDYVARPNDRKTGGSDAITEDKGLYFINSDRSDTTKPVMLWTQGETESNSCWFPTIDKPNQKCTEEIFITVSNEFVTLSNGELVSSTDNKNGTRTDYWRMNLPHSVYLFFMGVGEFAVVKDTWRDKEVNYYVDKRYENTARRLFGETPAMMEFFSKKLGVDYPWQKYAQMVGQDFVSGAMENTSCTLQGDMLRRNARQVIDEDFHDYISHELFHQWFGDLVTCESWSNTPLNESFADYGEYLWNEERYGKNYADEKRYLATKKYFTESRTTKNVELIRFFYTSQEDMFDAHSYEKGGAILNMLRNYVGDAAFFKSLQLYLTKNKFKNVEIHDLRLAFEETTGEDLNWFFNQWFFNAGHPKIDVQYTYDGDSIFLNIQQKQNIEKGLNYKIPTSVNLYYGKTIDTRKFVIERKNQRFAFPSLGKLDLADFDPNRIILCERSENKSIEQYIFQYQHGTHFLQRFEALDSLKKYQKLYPEISTLFKEAMNDPAIEIRLFALKASPQNTTPREELLNMINERALHDISPKVRATAVEMLGKFRAKKYLETIQHALKDSSYQVEALALIALYKVDSTQALKECEARNNEENDRIKDAIYTITAYSLNPANDEIFRTKIKKEKGFMRYTLFYHYATYLLGQQNPTILNGLDFIKTTAIDDQNKTGIEYAMGSIQRVKQQFEVDLKKQNKPIIEWSKKFIQELKSTNK